MIMMMIRQACDLREAPQYRWRDPTSVYKVCTLRCDLTDVPVSSFTVLENCSGAEYYVIDFDLKLSLVNDVLQFEMLLDGKNCGQVTAKFE